MVMFLSGQNSVQKSNYLTLSRTSIGARQASLTADHTKDLGRKTKSVGDLLCRLSVDQVVA